ncbi:MAG: UDP-N-acetylmuramoyl-L-alanine--D-glutamate ligase [Methylococcales bacterium]
MIKMSQQLQSDHPGNLGAVAMNNGAAKAIIVGMGKTGLSVARFLTKHGIEFAITDTREQPPGLAELEACCPNAAVFLGGFRESAFFAATHIVVSPGVSLAEPLVESAVKRGVALISDIDLFVCDAEAPIIAVTGSNGKSTVTTLVGQMAAESGKKVKMGANLGPPALDLLGEEVDLYVLELSSFQLERTHLLRPAAAVVLNISPDHMDRYESLEAYKREKQRIFDGDGIMVINADDPAVAAMKIPKRSTIQFSVQPHLPVDFGVGLFDGEQCLIRRGQSVIPVSELKITGRHNRANALAALALGEAVGLEMKAMLTALRKFPGLEHRMQWVAEKNGVTWINDSKATNVGACLAALEGIDEKVVLIAGGEGKGADFSELSESIGENARAVVLIGKDADLLQQAMGGGIVSQPANEMQQAVEIASSLALYGDTVLLSPACASLDQYSDYQERGWAFINAVKGLLS